MVEGFLLFIQYVFDHFSFRKLYFEVPEFNDALLQGMDGHPLRREGNLVGHQYHAGRFWDMRIWALYRDDWSIIAAPFFDDYGTGGGQ